MGGGITSKVQWENVRDVSQNATSVPYKFASPKVLNPGLSIVETQVQNREGQLSPRPELAKSNSVPHD